MSYSSEQIYLLSGQFDKIVSVTFGYETNARKLYGDFITGEFIYSKEERIKLEEKLKQKPLPSTAAFIRFRGVLKSLSKNKREQLYNIGIYSSEIASILQSDHPEENKFTMEGIKELQPPIEIKIDSSGADADNSLLGLNNSRLKNGYNLIPDEIDQHNGIVLKKFKKQISESDLKNHFIDQTTGKIKSNIYYHFLKRKFEESQLTSEEEKEFQEIFEARMKIRLQLIKSELKKATVKLKGLNLNFNKALANLLRISSSFEQQRLTNSKFPIWWDYERFLHVFMRHVKETQVGERFEEKTVFQYKLKDVKRLVEIVLKKVDIEIQKHFSSTPSLDFKRHGKMAAYYNGDYYNIHIEHTGRLMTFYKQSVRASKKYEQST